MATPFPGRGCPRQYQFRLVVLTCGALGTDQNSTPYMIRRESQGDTQLSVIRARKLSDSLLQVKEEYRPENIELGRDEFDYEQ
jgi:hypothetical protein